MPITTSNILPKEPKGESSGEPIWASVGWALSRWEGLQSRLILLFVRVAQRDPANYALLRAFGYNMVVLAKLDMIEQAAAVALGDVDEKLFNKTRDLLSRIRGYNERRNDIAHGIASKVDPTDTGTYLVPTHTTTKKMKLVKLEQRRLGKWWNPDYCWTAAQINRYGDAFDALASEVSALTSEIEQRLEKTDP